MLFYRNRSYKPLAINVNHFKQWKLLKMSRVFWIHLIKIFMDLGSQTYKQYSIVNKYLEKKQRYFTVHSNITAAGTYIHNFKFFKRFLFFLIILLFLFIIMYTPVYLRYNRLNATINIIGWTKDTNRNTRIYVRPDVDTTIHEPKLVCCDRKGTDKKQKLLLVIIVLSSTKNFAKRSNVRETWGNYNNYLKINEIMISVREKYKNYNSYTIDSDTNIDNLAENFKPHSIKKDLIDKFKPFKSDSKSLNVKHEPTKTCLKKRVNQTLNNLELDFRIVFLLGLRPNYGPKGSTILQNKIDAEAKRYGDILQEGFVDSYSNLTLKSIMMLKWITNKCKGKVRYFMKTDDDAYINVPKLVTKLNKTATDFDKNIDQGKKENLLIGSLIKGSKPRRQYAKYYVPKYMYNKRFYPPYLSGSGYVFSSDTADALYNAALVTNYLNLEDVFITGLCAARANAPIIPKNDVDFSNVIVNLSNHCLAYSVINTHYVRFRYQMNGLEQQLLQPQLQDMCERKRCMNIKNRTSALQLFSYEYLKRFLKNLRS